MNLAGQTLGAGVYNSTGGILISGPVPLTLDGGGNADAVFIFQAAAAGDLTVDPTSNIVYTNGAQPCNVFWKVQSAFLKNTGFTFVGTILALTQITLTDNITVQGRVLARNADVTFIHDVVNKPTTCVTQASIDAPHKQLRRPRQLRTRRRPQRLLRQRRRTLSGSRGRSGRQGSRGREDRSGGGSESCSRRGSRSGQSRREGREGSGGESRSSREGRRNGSARRASAGAREKHLRAARRRQVGLTG